MLQRAFTKVLPDPYYSATSTVFLRAGVNGTPSWSSVSLASDITGTLPVGNGGTALSTLAAHALYVGNGASAPTALSVGANNTYLKGSTGADPSFSTVTLASADFANQGTTTTVLHGNAAGNPSFGAVSLTADITGTLATGHGGTGVTGASVGAASGAVLGDTGTFTPTVLGSTTAGTTTYTVQQGNYTRVGDRCIFNLRVDWTAVTGTGNLLIGGMPFTSNATLWTSSVFPGYISFNVALETGYFGLLNNNSAQIGLYGYQAGTGAAQIAIQAAGLIIMSGSYLL